MFFMLFLIVTKMDGIAGTIFMGFLRLSLFVFSPLFGRLGEIF